MGPAPPRESAIADDDRDEYAAKRDLGRTPEPDGASAGGGERPRFVIHEHHASTLHYDLRLEVGGVLASWAVPKGSSTDPRERRLAIRVEDHPLDHADFEGVIPQGRYGAGPVIVWDAGFYRDAGLGEGGDDPPDVASQLEQGHVEVWLEGHMLRGGYALTRTAMGDDDDKWLLVKLDDEGADARRDPTSTEPRSVKSGRTLDEVRAQAGGAEDDG